MPRNVEIKARLRDPEAVRRRAADLSDAPAVVLDQEDTFFRVPEGRFKLRTFPNGRGELIYYDRQDEAGPKTSEYFVHRTQDPATLRDLLARACGIRAVVRKRRTLYLAGRTRIHLDEVEGLGSFLELEVVLEDDMESEEGATIADELLDRLGVPAEDRVACAYVDLLEEHAT
ncbi:MAG: class IV adenylate cyclase [Candidatus Bipolaricaulota bacterium]|nr:class IV adenylate cyclase [Candidatus Bipolaricaulota bacterium]